MFETGRNKDGSYWIAEENPRAYGTWFGDGENMLDKEYSGVLHFGQSDIKLYEATIRELLEELNRRLDGL